MSLRDYLRVLRKRWMSITAIALLAIGGAALATALTPKVYEARTQMFVAIASQDSSAGQILSGSQFTLQRVKSYTQMASSPRVLDPVIKDLGLNTTSVALAQQVSASSPLDTVLVNISVTSRSPVEAARVSNAVAVQFGLTIEALETPRSGGTSPVKVSVVDPAGVPTVPVSPKPKINIALGVLLGLALGVGYALLRETLDTSIRTPDDLQAATGTSPLGVIAYDPDAKKKPLPAWTPGRFDPSPSASSGPTCSSSMSTTRPPRGDHLCAGARGQEHDRLQPGRSPWGRPGLRVCSGGGRPSAPEVADYLGVENAVGLTNVLAGQHGLDDVLIAWNRGWSTSSPPGRCRRTLRSFSGPRNMASAPRRAHSRFDTVLLDAPPLLPVTDAAVLHGP